MKRRNFLQGFALTAAGAVSKGLMPSSAQAAGTPTHTLPEAQKGNLVVLASMDGLDERTLKNSFEFLNDRVGSSVNIVPHNINIEGRARTGMNAQGLYIGLQNVAQRIEAEGRSHLPTTILFASHGSTNFEAGKNNAGKEKILTVDLDGQFGVQAEDMFMSINSAFPGGVNVLSLFTHLSSLEHAAKNAISLTNNAAFEINHVQRQARVPRVYKNNAGEVVETHIGREVQLINPLDELHALSASFESIPPARVDLTPSGVMGALQRTDTALTIRSKHFASPDTRTPENPEAEVTADEIEAKQNQSTFAPTPEVDTEPAATVTATAPTL